MMKNIAILLEDGFEEIEAIVPIDVLRRLGFNLVLAGKTAKVAGAHSVKIETDALISELKSEDLDAIILPGGLPGSTNLRDNSDVIKLVSEMYSAGKLVAAICAAPIVLAEAGIMHGAKCTGYPMDMLKKALSDANYTAGRIEQDGNIITGKGPGAAFEFAVAIASCLGKQAQARSLMKSMFQKI